jgi:hypothetical protein
MTSDRRVWSMEWGLLTNPAGAACIYRAGRGADGRSVFGGKGVHARDLSTASGSSYGGWSCVAVSSFPRSANKALMIRQPCFTLHDVSSSCVIASTRAGFFGLRVAQDGCLHTASSPSRSRMAAGTPSTQKLLPFAYRLWIWSAYTHDCFSYAIVTRSSSLAKIASSS